VTKTAAPKSVVDEGDVHGLLCEANKIESDLRRVAEARRVLGQGGSGADRSAAESRYFALRDSLRTVLEQWKNATAQVQARNRAAAEAECAKLAVPLQKSYNAYIAEPSFEGREAYLKVSDTYNKWSDVIVKAHVANVQADDRVRDAARFW
jgi:hypothetical protein